MRPGNPRVRLDLNVLVAAEIALVKGRTGTTPIRLVDACRRGRFDLVVSRHMLDRLADVLARPPLALDHALAAERVALVAELADLPNRPVAGGGVMPLADTEDRGVLESALAGRADYLATYNLSDFTAAARPDPATGGFRVRDLCILPPPALAELLGV